MCVPVIVCVWLCLLAYSMNCSCEKWKMDWGSSFSPIFANRKNDLKLRMRMVAYKLCTEEECNSTLVLFRVLANKRWRWRCHLHTHTLHIHKVMRCIKLFKTPNYIDIDIEPSSWAQCFNTRTTAFSAQRHFLHNVLPHSTALCVCIFSIHCGLESI